MLSAGVESLEKRDFDAFSSSMSAVLQELYAGLPAALSAECPARVLGGNPEAFVLSCGGLPSEHQRTHGLSIRPSNPPERLDPTGKISHPGLMDLLVEEAGGLVREDGTPNVNAAKWDSLWVRPREGADVSEGLADTAEEDSVLCPLSLEEETCGPKEEETCETRGASCSNLSCVEPLALLQNLEEDEAKEQRTPENLPDSGVEPQGVAADGTAPFSETREQTAGAQAGVLLEHSGVEATVAKIAVPGTSALPSLEPLSLTGDTLTRGQSQEEDECRGPTGDGSLSATSDVVPSSEAGREKFLLYEGEEMDTPVENRPPAQRNEKNPHEHHASAPVLESGIPVGPRPLGLHSEPSGCICGSNLTFENEQWEGSTDTFEVICETEEAGRFNDDESLKIELLEGWTSHPKTEESRSPTWSCEDLYDECEREMDHSYSCACKEDVETHNRIPVHRNSGKETLENSHLGESKGSLVIAANRRNLENGSPPLRELTLRPIREESPISGTDRVQEIGHRLSPPPSDEGSATLVKENQARLEDVNSLGCFQNNCTVSIDSHSPCLNDSLDCDPESGEGGVSQTVPRCNQKTEILEAFPALNLPPADSSVVNINLAPQEEDAETTPTGDGVFGGPMSLESLSGDGEFLGSHAKLQGMQGLSGLPHNREELVSVSQNGSRKEDGETRHGTEVTLRDGVKRKGDKEDAWSEACSPSDPCINDLCSVLELCCTVSGGLPFDDVPDVRTETNTEESAGVEAREACASDRKIASPHTCGGDSHGLDQAENAAESAPDGKVSSSGLLEDEALVDETKNQWGIVGNTLVKSEGITGANSGVFAPHISQELTEDPITAVSDGTETTDAYEDGQRSQLGEKQACDGDLGKTLHPAELDRHVSKGEEGGYRASPLCSSSSASDCSGLKADLNSDSLGCVAQQERSLLSEDVCTKGPGQPGGTACRMKSQPLVNEDYCVDSPVLFDEKDEVGILEWAPLPVMFSEKQKVDDDAQTSVRTAAETQKCVSEEEDGDFTQTVVFLAEKTPKFVSCTQNASTHVTRDQSLMPKVPAPVLSMESSIQGTLQQSAINNRSPDKMVAELESVELKSAQECLGCSELASKALELNGFVQDQALQAETDGFHPFSEANADELDKNPFLKISSAALSPGQTLFQPKPLTFSTSGVQERAESAHLDSREEREMPRSVCPTLVAETLQQSEISQEGRPSALPSLQTLSSSHVKEPPLEIVFFDRETDALISWPGSENEDGSSSVKEETCADSPLFCKEIPVSLTAGKQGTEDVASLLCRDPEPPKVPQSSEDDQRGMNSAVEKMELPVLSCLDTSDSSGTLLRDSICPTGEEETTFPFGVETQMRQPCVCLLEGTSGRGFSRPKYPSETVVAPHCSPHVGSAWQTEGLFPTSSPEILSKASVYPSPFGGILEASLECLRRAGRPLQDVEVAGVQMKLSVGQSVTLGLEVAVNKARASEAGDCPEFPQKQEGKETQTPAPFVSSCGTVSPTGRTKKDVKAKGVLKRRRILEIEHPLGGFSHEMEHEGPAQRHFPAAGGRVDTMDSRNLQRNLWEPKRPKRSEGPVRVELVKAERSGLCFNNGSWPLGLRGSPLLAFCTSSQTAGLNHSRSTGANNSPWRMRKHHLILRRQPAKAWGVEAPVVCRFRAPKQPPPETSPAFLGSSSEIGPRHGCKLIGPAASSSVKNTRVVILDPSLRQRGTRASLLLDIFRPSKHTKEPALLRTLSALADKLLAPPRNAQKFKPLMSPPTPGKYSQLGSKTLLELFSSVETNLNSQCVNTASSCSFKHYNSPSSSLSPLESATLCVLELSGRTPFAFGAPAFPALFYVKAEPVATGTLSVGVKAPRSISPRWAWREMSAQLPSKWTSSFPLSQNVAGIRPAPKETRALAPLQGTRARNEGKHTITHHVPGLQTVLALFSPGCWCLWVRKRHLPRRVLPTQRLTLLRLTGASKGLNFSSADFSSSLPSTLDGRLPAWRRLDSPPGSPSEISPLCAPGCAWRQEVAPITTTWPPLQLRLGFQSSSAMWPPVPDQSLEVPVTPKDGIRWEPSFSALIPTSLLIPEPAWSHLGRSAPGFPVHPLDELDVSVPTFPQSNARREQAESEKKPKKVSQIRIRKTIPKPDPNLTPMGLPRPKRLKKTEFSLEEIYTNKNYKSPPATRSLETIFEEPKEKNGSLISISHQKRKRILEFQDFTVPRKRRARSRVKVTGGFTRAQKAALEGRELDVLLIQRLTDLEAFLAEQEELGDMPGS